MMPGLSEAITCGLFSMLIFKMSFRRMSLGFILGAFLRGGGARHV